MYWWDIDDFIYFEKLRRKKHKRYPDFSLEDQKLLNSQKFGTIHTVSDSKIPDFRNKDLFFRKDRPGVVITPPQELSYETEWVPMSSKIQNRDPNRVVYLPKSREKVIVNSVILLNFRRWFKFKTLSHKKGELSEGKKIELHNKLTRLNKLENKS